MKSLGLIFLLGIIFKLMLHGQEIMVNSGITDVTFLKFSSDGRLLLSNSETQIKVMDYEKGIDLKTYYITKGRVEAATFSPENKKLVVSDLGNLYVFNLETDLIDFITEDHCTQLEFSTDGKMVYGIKLGSLVVYNPYNWGKKIVEKEVIPNMTTVAVNKNDGTLITGDKYGNIAIRDPKTLQKIKEVHVCNESIKILSFLNKYSSIVMYDGIDKIYVYDAKTLVYKNQFSHSAVTNQYLPTKDNWMACSNHGNYIVFQDGTTGLSKEIDMDKNTCTQTTIPYTMAVAASPASNEFIYGGSGMSNSSPSSIEFGSGNIKKTFHNESLQLLNLRFSADGNTLYSEMSGRKIHVWDLTTGKQISKLDIECLNQTFLVHPDNSKIISVFNDTLKVWDIKLNRLIEFHALNKDTYHSRFILTADGKNLVEFRRASLSKPVNELRVFNLTTYKIIDEYTTNEYTIEDVVLKENGKIDYLLAAIEISGAKEVHYLITPKGLKLPKPIEIGYGDGYIIKNNTCALISRNSTPIAYLWDFERAEPDLKYTILANKYNILSPDKSLLLTFSDTDQLFKLANLNDKTLIPLVIDNYIPTWKSWTNNEWILNKPEESVANRGNVAGAISSNNRLLALGSKKGVIRIVDIQKREEIIQLIATQSGEWVSITPDGYWDGSISSGNKVNMIEGLSSYGIDQFAVTNNRPDIILSRLGSKDTALIAHYNKQYKRRLKKLNLTEEKIVQDLHVPNSVITKNYQNGKKMELSFQLSDEKYILKSYNIFVNDVPLFGAYGKAIVKNKVNLNETIELSSGSNKIEVSCTNSKGIESFRDLLFARYDEPVKKDMYLLAFGVSNYNNATYNLAYADKDALDLSKVIEGYKSKGFENVYTKVLTNEQVTPEAIKAAKDFVKNAKPDDTFILFIAGHGMHDTDPEATYYYLTSNADVKNLKATAADFETIEDLLQGIPPRNKLFLMDACESGEIDEEDQGQMLAAATGSGMASRGFKSTVQPVSSNQQPAAKRSYLYQKDRYIYNDLVRRSGAIVFSSSKGGELSYERSDIENGLFTEYIMKALSTTEADKDENGEVSTDELRIYVSEQVSKASDDLQHPTVDRDNIYQKFGFGVK